MSNYEPSPVDNYIIPQNHRGERGPVYFEPEPGSKFGSELEKGFWKRLSKQLKQNTLNSNLEDRCSSTEPKIGPKDYPEFRLSDRQRKMAERLSISRNKRSPVAAIYFIAASLGKLLFGFGSSLVVKGHYANDQAILIGGCVCVGIGFVAVVFVALGFGAALQQIHKPMAILFKFVAIGGAIIIALGYALNQYFVSTHEPMLDIRLSFLPLMVGTAMLVFSISNFSAYTELARGRTPGLPLRHRPIIALCLLGEAIGILFAGWITGEHANWPPTFNAIVLTFSTASVYGGSALFWSNHVHREAEWASCCIALEQCCKS